MTSEQRKAEIERLRYELHALAKKFCRACKTEVPRKSKNGWWHHVVETRRGQYMAGCRAKHIYERLTKDDLSLAALEAEWSDDDR